MIIPPGAIPAYVVHADNGTCRPFGWLVSEPEEYQWTDARNLKALQLEMKATQ